MERDTTSTKFPIGSTLPQFELENVDGTKVNVQYFDNAKGSLVVFACNHCPYVIGSEKMLFETIKQFQAKGLKAVIISSNDSAQYPEDSFEKMKEKATRESMPCPYLFDETQLVAKAFDAQCTPECFLFDASKKLVYQGAVNNSPRNPEQASTNHLATALEQLFLGVNLNPNFAHPIGCSIKWK